MLGFGNTGLYTSQNYLPPGRSSPARAMKEISIDYSFLNKNSHFSFVYAEGVHGGGAGGSNALFP